MAFNMLDSLLRGKAYEENQEQYKSQKEQSGRVNVKYISVRDLIPSKDNFYSLEQIEELKTAIELAGKVLQNLTVTPLGDGKYKVLAGHRRRLAALMLLNEGKTQYEFLPCGVEEAEEDTEAQEIRDGILLIVANSQRVKTDWDKIEESRRMRELLERLNKKERIPGDKRKIVAEALNTTPAQIGRYDAISRNLLPELQKEIKEGKLGVSAAYELSSFTPNEQRRIFSEHNGELKYTEAKHKKVAAKPQGRERKQNYKAPKDNPAPSTRIKAETELPIATQKVVALESDLYPSSSLLTKTVKNLEKIVQCIEDGIVLNHIEVKRTCEDAMTLLTGL